MTVLTFSEEDVYLEHTGTSASSLHNPLHPGVWILNSTVSPRGGTLGCIVTGNADKKPYMLSNAHVMYYNKVNTAAFYKSGGKVPQTPDPIFQPPKGMPGSRQVGTVKPGTYWTPGSAGPAMTQAAMLKKAPTVGAYFDAAIANISVPFSYEIPGIGIPTGHIEPKAGMNYVAKPGGRLGTITGKIVSADAHDWRVIPSGTKIANHIFSFTTSQHILSGDSGSVLVEPSSKKVIGLLYGNITTTASGVVGLGIPASRIAQRYNVNFVGKGSGTSPTPTPTPGGTGGTGDDAVIAFIKKNPGIVLVGGAALVSIMLFSR